MRVQQLANAAFEKTTLHISSVLCPTLKRLFKYIHHKFLFIGQPVHSSNMPSAFKRAVSKIRRPSATTMASQLPSSQVTKVYLDCTPPLFETFFTADHPPEPLEISKLSTNENIGPNEDAAPNVTDCTFSSPETSLAEYNAGGCFNASGRPAAEETNPDSSTMPSSAKDSFTALPRFPTIPPTLHPTQEAIRSSKSRRQYTRQSSVSKYGNGTGKVAEDFVVKHDTEFVILN